MIDTMSVSIGERVILLPKGDYYLRYRDRFEVTNEFVIPAKSFRQRAPFRPKVFIATPPTEPDVKQTAKSAGKPAKTGARTATATKTKTTRIPATVGAVAEPRVPAEMLRGKLIKLDKRKRKRR